MHPTNHVVDSRPQRWLVAASGVALAAAGAAVAWRDPSPSSGIVACPFHAVTGWWCPMCGLTRGTARLLRGDLLGSLAMNPLTPLIAVAVVGCWVVAVQRAWGRPPGRVRRLLARCGDLLVTPAAIAALVVFGVARNLPGLAWLAPPR